MTAFIVMLHMLISQRFIRPILDDGLKERILNPERAFSVITFVCACLCVSPWAREHSFWPRNLIFGLSDHGKEKPF